MPYSLLQTAYDAGYAPPEQAAIEAAVNAGAAGYPGVSDTDAAAGYELYRILENLPEIC